MFDEQFSYCWNLFAFYDIQEIITYWKAIISPYIKLITMMMIMEKKK